MIAAGAFLISFGLVIAIVALSYSFVYDDSAALLVGLVGVLFVVASIPFLEIGTDNKNKSACKRTAAELKLGYDWDKGPGCRFILPDGRKVADEKYRVNG